MEIDSSPLTVGIRHGPLLRFITVNTEPDGNTRPHPHQVRPHGSDPLHPQVKTSLQQTCKPTGQQLRRVTEWITGFQQIMEPTGNLLSQTKPYILLTREPIWFGRLN